MYVTMMDFMKKYPAPNKETIIKNAIDDIYNYKQTEYKQNYFKKINQLAKQLLSKKHSNYIKTGNLSQYYMFTRVRYRDRLKELIDRDINRINNRQKTKRKKPRKTKRKKIY